MLNLRDKIPIINDSFSKTIPNAILLVHSISLGNFLLRPNFLSTSTSLISSNSFSYDFDNLIMPYPKYTFLIKYIL